MTSAKLTLKLQSIQCKPEVDKMQNIELPKKYKRRLEVSCAKRADLLPLCKLRCNTRGPTPLL